MAFGIKWLKPELDEPKYWFHLVILSAVVLYILQLFSPQMSIGFKEVLYFVPVLVIGDFIAHTSLQLD